MSEYTSKQHIRRCGSNEGRRSSSEQLPKRIRRSEVSPFNYLEHCIFVARIVHLNMTNATQAVGDHLIIFEPFSVKQEQHPRRLSLRGATNGKTNGEGRSVSDCMVQSVTYTQQMLDIMMTVENDLW